MSGPLLKRGDKGKDVGKLQSLLNRAGAMLKPDEDFGFATYTGVMYAQGLAGQPVTGMADNNLWNWLDARPEPFPPLDTDGVAFIALEETGGLSYYDAITCWPHYPGEASGITIGIGYDLRWNTRTDFLSVWGQYLSDPLKQELLKDIGKKGTKQRTTELKQLGVKVPFEFAWLAFLGKTLPRFYRETVSVYPSLEHLPKLCRSVLVSLVYNRGSDLTEDRKIEMRTIQAILTKAEKVYPDKELMKSILIDVEEQILSMKRLWAPGSGLVKRRQEETNLWRTSLAQW